MDYAPEDQSGIFGWEGRRADEINSLSDLIPDNGPVSDDAPFLEMFRVFQNAYFDLYVENGAGYETHAPRLVEIFRALQVNPGEEFLSFATTLDYNPSTFPNDVMTIEFQLALETVLDVLIIVCNAEIEQQVG